MIITTKNHLSNNDIIWIKENMIKGDSNLGIIALSEKYNVDKKIISDIYHDKKYQDIKCKYTLFICSDIHGGYTEMIKALKEAKFNENKYNHKLIVLGDIFDRLPESVKVYNYLKNLTYQNRAIVTFGNHNNFLINYLDGTTISPFNYFNNGVNETFASFLNILEPFEHWYIDKNIEEPTVEDFTIWIREIRNEMNKAYPELLSWLKSMPRYVETEHYIGVHGAIDTYAEDWHKPHCFRGNFTDWDALDFDDGSFFGKQITNTDKTIIIGHFGTSHLRKLYPGNGDGHGILKRKDGRVIALDATTCYTGDVNILIIENEKFI